MPSAMLLLPCKQPAMDLTPCATFPDRVDIELIMIYPESRVKLHDKRRTDFPAFFFRNGTQP